MNTVENEQYFNRKSHKIPCGGVYIADMKIRIHKIKDRVGKNQYRSISNAIRTSCLRNNPFFVQSDSVT